MKGRVTTLRRLLSFATACLGIFSIPLCQSTCPTRCLCYLSQQPRAIVCTRQDLEAFPENISDVVEELHLSYNLLRSINSDINRLTDLQSLYLAKNKLSSLPEELSSLKNLQKLDLRDNEIHEITNIASIGQLPSLKFLYLSRNPLSTLEGLVSRSIEALDVSLCDVRALSNTSLEGLPALITLKLTGNPLKFIENPWCPKLRSLDMSDCLLNYLSPSAFDGFPELEELRLVNNPTLTYSTRFSTLKHPKLKKLDVSRCNLDRPGLHGLPSLTHARLSHNMINKLPDRIFAKNRELGFLYLNANGIENLNVSVFEGLVKLQVLDLSTNSIETIHSLTFHENIELKLLNMSYNILHEFPNLTSSSLTLLDVSSNIITKFTDNSLANVPKIRSIILSDNRLQKIPTELKSTTLKNLDLRRNRIMEVYNDTFLQLPQLIRVDLSGNRLTEALDPEIFRNNPNLNIIKLEDNPWRCDCRELFIMYSYLTIPPAKTSESKLICQSPANVSGFTWENACYEVWNAHLFHRTDRTWGFIFVSGLTIMVLLGSFVSIKHMMRIKRRTMVQRQQLETVRVLRQRRVQVVEEEPVERTPEPRIHPMELIGPPSYEEAVQMPRLARSLDNLDEISVETSLMGSADNLRSKQRRNRRTKKRTHSEDDLLRREERRQERIRRERNNTAGNSGSDLPVSHRNPRSHVARSARRHSIMTDANDTGSGRARPRPQTPSARKRRSRRSTVYDDHSSDDEDSDIQAIGSSKSIVIRELRREPRSGYREPPEERDS